jgi:thymidylate kinase
MADQRLVTRKDTNRFEHQGAGYLEKVRQEYLRWARRRNVPVVDGGQPPPQARASARQIVKALVTTSTHH